MLVCIEGIDRAGKTTLCAALEARLGAEAVRFPEYGAPVTGPRILAALQQSECPLPAADMHRLFAENRAECAAALRAKIASGRPVVMDRYVLSGAAYSMANGLSMDWCLNQEARLPAPDIVVYLDADPELAASRDAYGAQFTERLDYQRRVREAYMRLMEANVYGNWHVFSALTPRDELADAVAALIRRQLCV